MNWMFIFFVTSIALLSSQRNVSAEVCTYNRTSGRKTGNVGSAYKGQFDIDACELACTEDSTCKALHVKDGICFHSTGTSSSVDAGSTFSLKSCTNTSETTLATSTTSATSTTPITSTTSTTDPSSGNCRKMNTKGGINYFARLKVDDMSCRDLCRFLVDCESVSYDGSQCKIFTNVTSTSPLIGSKHAVKTACITGHMCCLNVAQDTTGSDSPDFVLNNTVESCEHVCKLHSSCTGASWKGSECTLYTYNTTTSEDSGSSFFDKSCLNGVGTGSSTFTKLCMSSTSGLRSGLLVFVLLFFKMLCV